MTEKKPLMIKLDSLIPNPENPRAIKDEKFERLKASLKKYPKLMELNPLKIDEENIIIAGNQRRDALVDLGYTEIPESWIKLAHGLTPEERKAYIVLDNHHMGEDDFDIMGELYSADELKELGIDIEMVDAEQIFDAPPPTVQENIDHLNKIKEQRAKGNEGIKDKTDTEKYLVIVFDSRSSKEAILAKLGLPSDERYVPANTITIIKKGKFTSITPHKSANRKKSGSQG